MITASHREWVLGAICLVAIVGVLFVPPIPQDPAYHRFIDSRTIFGVPNFWNVFSNIGYLIVGLYGLAQTRRLPSREMIPAYVTFCFAVTLVAFGSAYYHYAPTTQRLVWDRLPMAIGFMALLSLLLSERVSWKLGRALLWPLVIVGMASVFYWAWTEERGVGDLRPYGLVQFLPTALIPLLLLMFPGSRRSAMWFWYTFAAYALSKIAEQLDGTIYNAVGMSGHAIKHFVSSVSVLFLVYAVLEIKASQPAR